MSCYVHAVLLFTTTYTRLRWTCTIRRPTCIGPIRNYTIYARNIAFANDNLWSDGWFLIFFFKWNYEIVTLTWINGLWAKYDKKCTCLSVFNNHRRRLDKLYSLVAGRGFISCNLKFVCTVYNVPVSRDLYLEPSLVEDLLLFRYFVTVPLWNYAKGTQTGHNCTWPISPLEPIEYFEWSSESFWSTVGLQSCTGMITCSFRIAYVWWYIRAKSPHQVRTGCAPGANRLRIGCEWPANRLR